MAASRRVPRGMHVAAGVAASAAAVVWIIRRRRRADALADDHEPPPPPPKLGQATSMSRASPSTRDDLREAFVSLANDDGVLEVHEFQAVIRQLRFDLSETEVRRVFARIDTDGVGRITCDQFLKGVQRIPFLRSVVSNYSPRHQTAFRVPADYDYATYTNANYGAPADAGFHGEFAEIRAGRDYGYHVNYARARQLWQDAAISMVVTRTHPQPRPWIVFTCGPMGAGKGYVMSWMSSSGLFPLEQIVHIDPDHFKARARARSDPLVATRLTRRPRPRASASCPSGTRTSRATPSARARCATASRASCRRSRRRSRCAGGSTCGSTARCATVRGSRSSSTTSASASRSTPSPSFTCNAARRAPRATLARAVA